MLAIVNSSSHTLDLFICEVCTCSKKLNCTFHQLNSFSSFLCKVFRKPLSFCIDLIIIANIYKKCKIYDSIKFHIRELYFNFTFHYDNI